MSIVITVFDRSPDGGRGLARDVRVRWALEEVGQRYEVRPLSFDSMKKDAHLAIHPFGQIPTYEDGKISLFESGAIVLHIAETYTGLLPAAKTSRERAKVWMFAALNTVEPPILELQNVRLLEVGMPWYEQHIDSASERVRQRLQQLSLYLESRDWLEEKFTAADLLMASVLLRVKLSGLLDDYPNLKSYVERAERRPAYLRAFASQLAHNKR